jgi:GT2 family glycosyltransferase
MAGQVSVIVPTYERCASVQRALRALSQQTVSPDQYEVIVAIDGSEDGTKEMVAHFPAPYSLRALWQSNRGRAAACNAGVRIATGQLLIFLDDDMEPVPEFLAGHMRAHHRASRVGVIGAAPIVFSRSSPAVAQFVGAKFNSHLATLAQPNHRLKLRDFYSGNFSIDRDLLLEVGPFDESFKIYGNEDLELSVRLSKAGVQLVFDSEALAYQHYAKDFAALAHDHIAKGRTAVLLATKHPETYPELKLSMYGQGSRRWRFLRGSLLLLNRTWVNIPEWIICFMKRVERRWPSRFHFCCFLALDYFYWLGAKSALRDMSETGQVSTVTNELLGKTRT